jgi:MinD-like ATPase involved in chromosome partitioning or flagellar assembly
MTSEREARQVATTVPDPVALPAAGRPTGWRRAVRAATFGLVSPGVAEAARRGHVLVARARARPDEPRVIAFVAAKGGVGTTASAAGVALSLAAVRSDVTAVLATHTGAGSLPDRLGTRTPAGAAMSRLAVVDDVPWQAPVPRLHLMRLLEQQRRRHPLTLVDLGNELSDAAHGALGRADQVVVVTSASPDAVATMGVALSRIQQVDPDRLASMVVVITCLTPRQHRHAARRLGREHGIGGDRIVVVPFDPALAHVRAAGAPRLRDRTQVAYLRIAGLVAQPGEGTGPAPAAPHPPLTAGA